MSLEVIPLQASPKGLLHPRLRQHKLNPSYTLEEGNCYLVGLHGLGILNDQADALNKQ